MLSLVENPHSNHLREMAAYFDADLQEEYDASKITMDNKHGKGFISSYQLFPGLLVWVYNIYFHSNFKVLLELSKDGPYYFSYNVKGHFLHRYLIENSFTKILQGQNMIIKGENNSEVEIVFPSNIMLKTAVIVIDIEKLKGVDIRNARRLFNKIQNVFQVPKEKHSFLHIGNIETKTFQFASIVCENNDIDLIGGLKTEGAMLNMLASQLEDYNRNLNNNITKPILLESELSKLTSIGAYIQNNLDKRIYISNLSKIYGISPTKLQLGIKYLYGDTVSSYIINVKMGCARDLIITTDLNISEICYRVGFSSRSYFSKQFKNRYGSSPSNYRDHLE